MPGQVPRDGNNSPITSEAASGYVAGSGAVSTTATTDYTYTFAAQINHLMINNNTAASIQWELDVPATAGSPVLASGQTLFLDIQCTVVHLYTAGIQPVNGTSASNIVLRGWY